MQPTGTIIIALFGLFSLFASVSFLSMGNFDWKRSSLSEFSQSDYRGVDTPYTAAVDPQAPQLDQNGFSRNGQRQEFSQPPSPKGRNSSSSQNTSSSAENGSTNQRQGQNQPQLWQELSEEEYRAARDLADQVSKEVSVDAWRDDRLTSQERGMSETGAMGNNQRASNNSQGSEEDTSNFWGDESPPDLPEPSPPSNWDLDALPSSNGIDADFDIPAPVGWFLAALLLIIVVFLIAKVALEKYDQDQEFEAPNKDETQKRSKAAQKAVKSLKSNLELAEELAAQGEYNKAIHILLLALFDLTSKSSKLKAHDFETAREYLIHPRITKYLPESDLEHLVLTSEKAHFGRLPLIQADWELSRTAYQNIIRTIGKRSGIPERFQGA